MIKLTIEDNHFMNNIFHILKWDAQRNLNLLRKPVDKGKLDNITRLRRKRQI